MGTQSLPNVASRRRDRRLPFPADSGVGGGGGSFIASTPKVGIRLTNRFAIVATSATVGVGTSRTGVTFRSPQTVGVLTSRLPITGTLVNQDQRPGISTAPRISQFTLPSTPSAQIVQVTYDLTRRVGGATQAAVGTAWTNGANATGIHNASNATCVGSIPGNTNGIELSYANHTLKGELTITQAKLFVYSSGVDATGLLLDTTISYNIGAGLTTLEVIAGAYNSLTTPREYTIPLDNWTEYDALQARVVCVFAAASATANAALDGIEIELLATLTDAL